MYCISYPKLCSFVTNNIVLLLMFTITHRKLLILTCAFKSLVTFVTVASYKRLCIIQKRNCLQLSSANVNGVVSCFRFFSYDRAKENVKYFFSAWLPDHGLLVKDDQQWKTFWMIYNMAMLGRKKIFPTYQLWRHNILYRTRYLVLPAFWSHSVLLKIGQYAKENLMIYILSIFGKIIFLVTVNYDVISI